MLERDDASASSRGPMGGRHGADGAFENRDRYASGGRREKGAHLLVRVVHPRDAEERGGEEGGKSHETKEFEQPSDPGRRESERTGVNLDGWNVGRDTRETTGRGSTRAPEEGREAHGEPEGHHDVSTDRGDERGRAFGETRHPPRVARRAPRECQRPMLTFATTMSSDEARTDDSFCPSVGLTTHAPSPRRVLESDSSRESITCEGHEYALARLTFLFKRVAARPPLPPCASLYCAALTAAVLRRWRESSREASG